MSIIRRNPYFQFIALVLLLCLTACSSPSFSPTMIVTIIPSDVSLNSSDIQSKIPSEGISIISDEFSAPISSIASSNTISTILSQPSAASSSGTVSEDGMIHAKTVSKVVHASGISYVEANGAPHLMYGVQMRIDDYFAGSVSIDKIEGMEMYFKKSAEIGFKTVIVSLPWNYVEFTEGEYEFDILLRPIIAYAEKYKLSVHLNWFGSVFVGWPNTAPNYIFNDRQRFPRIDGVQADPYDFSNPLLRQKEILAVQAVMDFIAKTDTNSRVIMFTVAAEPDMRPVTNTFWGGQREERINNNISPLGDAVHNSLRNMVTRVYSTNEEMSLEDVFNTSGVDIVGLDPYNIVPAQFKQIVNRFSYAGNVPHAAENGGQYKNYENMVIAAFDEGAGYLTYELRTTGAWRNYDFGIYRKTTPEMDEWIERDGTKQVAYFWDGVGLDVESSTSDISKFNSTVNKADKKIAVCPKKLSAAFNLTNEAIASEKKTIGNLEITATTNDSALGFSFVDMASMELVLVSFKGSTSFSFPENLIGNGIASEGFYSKSNSWTQVSTRNISDGKIQVSAGEVLKIPASVWMNK